jgi:hypothetical protein
MWRRQRPIRPPPRPAWPTPAWASPWKSLDRDTKSVNLVLLHFSLLTPHSSLLTSHFSHSYIFSTIYLPCSLPSLSSISLLRLGRPCAILELLVCNHSSSPKPKPSQNISSTMRFTALLPLACAITSFVLSLFCLLAGSPAGYMEEYHIVAVSPSNSPVKDCIY